MLCIVLVVLMVFMIVSCTNKDSTDGNSELPETADLKEQPDAQFDEYTRNTIWNRTYIGTRGRLGKR
jgi:biopolymer transport protein ExbD